MRRTSPHPSPPHVRDQRPATSNQQPATQRALRSLTMAALLSTCTTTPTPCNPIPCSSPPITTHSLHLCASLPFLPSFLPSRARSHSHAHSGIQSHALAGYRCCGLPTRLPASKLFTIALHIHFQPHLQTLSPSALLLASLVHLEPSSTLPSDGLQTQKSHFRFPSSQIPDAPDGPPRRERVTDNLSLGH